MNKIARERLSNRGIKVGLFVLFLMILNIMNVYALPLNNSIDLFNRADNAVLGTADSGSTWVEGGAGGCAILSEQMTCSGKAIDGHGNLTGLGANNIDNITIELKSDGGATRDGVITFYTDNNISITSLVFKDGSQARYGNFSSSTLWGNFSGDFANFTIMFDPSQDMVRFIGGTLSNDSGWVNSESPFDDVIKIGVQTEHVGGNNGDWTYNEIVSFQSATNLTINLFNETGKSSFLNKNISVEIFSDRASFNRTTTNGLLNISLPLGDDYIIRYQDISELFFERSFHQNLVQDITSLDLYLLNKSLPSSLSVIGTVITSLNEKLEDARISATKYDLSTNNFITMEKVDTNFEGKANMSLTTDEFYKFIVVYQNATKLTTTSTLITSDEITFVVDLGGDPTGRYFNSNDITFTLDYLNDSRLFTYTFNDPNTRFTETCLKISLVNTSLGDSIFNESCTTSHSGSISLGIKEINGSTYIARALATISGNETQLGSRSISFYDTANFGRTGLLIIILLTSVFATISIWNPFVSLLMTPIPLIMGSLLGIITISTAVVAGIFVAVGFIALFIGRSS